MRNKALAVGSVVFDIIFSVHNTLKDEILIKDGKAQNVSMMLTAEKKQQFFGGTGGNIAYGLGIQGENPLLFSVVGDDFNHEYKAHLEAHNIDLKLVVKANEYTATFYGISDAIRDQIGIFQPNTHGDYMEKVNLTDTLTSREFDQIKVAIFSPGTGISIRNHMREAREKCGLETTIIFDPSQILSIFFNEKLLKECIELSDIFIGNETEIDQLKKMLKLSEQEILDLGLRAIIETKGKEGVVIHSQKGTESVVAVQAKNFVEQTGAGDAFRAGLIKGLLLDFSISKACKLGAILGSRSVESRGGQEYYLD